MDNLSDIKNPCLVLDPGDIKRSYRVLACKYHPDKNPDDAGLASKNFSWIALAYEALCKLEETYGSMKGLRQFYDFEYGKVLVFDTSVTYAFDTEVGAVSKYTRKYNYPNASVEKAFSKPTPTVEDGMFVRVLKSANEIPLYNLLQYAPIDQRHVAWIVSRLLNTLCFLHFNNISHNAITPKNCFVNLATHEVSIYGGWHFATPLGDELRHVNGEIYQLLPESVKLKRKAWCEIDLVSVKEIAKQLLGVSMAGTKNDHVAKPFLQWLFAPVAASAIEEFSIWDKVLMSSFGERKFVVYPINMYDLYNVN